MTIMLIPVKEILLSLCILISPILSGWVAAEVKIPCESMSKVSVNQVKLNAVHDHDKMDREQYKSAKSPNCQCLHDKCEALFHSTTALINKDFFRYIPQFNTVPIEAFYKNSILPSLKVPPYRPPITA